MASAMRQTHPSVQVLCQHSKKNWPAKLNAAVRASDAEWVIILCDDDQLADSYVAECLQYQDGADVIYTDRLAFDGSTDANPEAAWSVIVPTHSRAMAGGKAYRVTHPPESFTFGSVLLMTVCVRRSLWDALGGYDEQMPHADTEFWYRLITAGARTVYVPQPLMYYRQHAGQQSKLNDSMVKFLHAFHRKHFLDFGIVFHGGTGRGDDALQLEPLAPDARLAYAAAHFTPLTTTGHMATEHHPLSPANALLLQFALDDSQRKVDAVITAIFASEGVSRADGWAVHPTTKTLYRTTPDAVTTVEETAAPLVPAS